MQNPSSLYHFETDGTGAVHQPGVLLVLLGAFIDAGNIQRTLGSHLLETGEPQIVASFDVDQLLDYRGRRPMMVFDADRWVSYDDPAILLHRLTDRDGQTYYVLTGPEPDYQWERFIEALRHVPDACQSVMLVGHNPELELFLETLTGVPEHLPTGGLAMIALPIASWRELHEGVRGKLRGLWSPKTLE